MVECGARRKRSTRIPRRDGGISEFLTPTVETRDEIAVPRQKLEPTSYGPAADELMPVDMLIDHTAETWIGRGRRAMRGGEIVLGLSCCIGHIALDRDRSADGATRRACGDGQRNDARLRRAIQGIDLP